MYVYAISRAIASALHCANCMLRCALPTRAHIHYPPLSLKLSLLYPLSFESYPKMRLPE
ncbi:hypothetical protein [Klebsiella phage Kpn13]|uniref:Uncharacterized protein n=1 Tax=Klebsiella phage Kpn13 TaxID=3044024 RepID=A0AAT9V662_9CAUD|nr:hypothetical protein [Klebsiella phage Kpn13]